MVGPLAVLAALASALLYALASVMQQQAAAAVPASQSLRPALLLRLLSRPAWVAGVGADGAAYALQFVALNLGALALVQPLLTAGLLFALPMGAAATHRRVTMRDWVGAGLLVAGLSLFLLSARPSEGISRASGPLWVLLAAATLLPAAILTAAARAESGALRAELLAAATGLTTGFTAALTKVAAGLLDQGVVHLFGAWQLYALVALGALSLLLSQSAFQAAPLAASLPLLSTMEPLVSIAIGVVVFGERLAVEPVALVSEAIGLLAMIVGIFVLGRSPLVEAALS